MNDPKRKTIRLDKLEIYGSLEKFQFITTQRTYMCNDVRLIDITSFQQQNIDSLLIVAYDAVEDAEICTQLKDYVDQNQPILFTHIAKVSNKREKHEIMGINGSLFMDGDRYDFNKVFVRVELKKNVPDRLIIDY